MKIFNWVHRRFHHKYDDDDEAAGNEYVTKNEFTKNGKLSLLDENAVVMDDGRNWKQGILTIGTFGFDHPSAAALLWKGDNFDEHQEEEETYISCEFRPFGSEEQEIKLPLVSKAAACHKHAFVHQKHDDVAQYYSSDEICYKNDNYEDGNHEEDISDEVVKVVVAKKGGDQRITLADLFWAHDHHQHSSQNNKKLQLTDQKVKVNHKYHSTTADDESITNTKHANNNWCDDYDDDDDRVALISMKKKKLMTKHHAPPRPINKINRMVRKMLKKKIHPDVENQKNTTATARFKHMRIQSQLPRAG